MWLKWISQSSSFFQTFPRSFLSATFPFSSNFHFFLSSIFPFSFKTSVHLSSLKNALDLILLVLLSIPSPYFLVPKFFISSNFYRPLTLRPFSFLISSVIFHFWILSSVSLSSLGFFISLYRLFCLLLWVKGEWCQGAYVGDVCWGDTYKLFLLVFPTCQELLFSLSLFQKTHSHCFPCTVDHWPFPAGQNGF